MQVLTSNSIQILTIYHRTRQFITYVFSQTEFPQCV